VGGDLPYEVIVGRGIASGVAAALPPDAERVLVVYSAPMAEAAERLTAEIAATGRMPVSAEVPDAEAGKTAEVMAFCWKVLGQSEFTRSDVVVGLGGGAITDLAGFVAASWLRGVRVIQVPTTLLGMVDAAIGGKTGINTAEGKNLVGAFHIPQSVWCDTEFLRTLPRHDLVAGLAEVVKAGFIRDLAIVDLIEANLPLLAASGTQDGDRTVSGADTTTLAEAALPVLEEAMVRAIQVKADVVGADLRESFLREILNYGHTFGHAIEYVERYHWRHGAAVSVGMVYAAELSRLVGRLGDEGVLRHRTVLEGLGLPTTYRGGRWDQLLTAMRRDKKTRGATLRFVILAGLGNPVRLEGPDPALLVAAYDAISST
jgi:3-dehydroquinate synthase